MLHGFFGDDWAQGIGPLHEQERRNYLFAAKSGGWASVKREYDAGTGWANGCGACGGGGGGATETVPFMRPLQGSLGQEIEAAERSWSEWLAMEDWMLGNRCPEGLRGVGAGSVGVKREQEQEGQGGGMFPLQMGGQGNGQGR